jgi:hypothetical protein
VKPAGDTLLRYSRSLLLLQEPPRFFFQNPSRVEASCLCCVFRCVLRYLVTLIIPLSYCVCVPSRDITNIPLCWTCVERHSTGVNSQQGFILTFRKDCPSYLQSFFLFILTKLWIRKEQAFRKFRSKPQWVHPSFTQADLCLTQVQSAWKEYSANYTWDLNTL